MNDNLLTWLKNTGLDEQRAQIYLSALSRGQATASELAEDLHLGRTTIYDNLRILQERGYLQTIRHGARQVFIPLHPKELYKKFSSQRDQLKDLLPDFLALYADHAKQPFIQMFEGPRAAREIFEDILACTKTEYVYFSPQTETIQTLDRSFIEQWVKRRVAKGLKSRSLRVKSKTLQNEPVFNEETAYLRQIRYLPAYMDLKAAIYLYENNIGVISTKKEGSAFIIHSADLAYSFKQIFTFLWSVSMKD